MFHIVRLTRVGFPGRDLKDHAFFCGFTKMTSKAPKNVWRKIDSTVRSVGPKKHTFLWQANWHTETWPVTKRRSPVARVPSCVMQFDFHHGVWCILRNFRFSSIRKAWSKKRCLMRCAGTGGGCNTCQAKKKSAWFMRPGTGGGPGEPACARFPVFSSWILVACLANGSHNLVNGPDWRGFIERGQPLGGDN